MQVVLIVQVARSGARMKHELACLLCKMPLQCTKGDLGVVREHVRREHEVVRWQVELLLHLSLLSRGEQEELVRLLGPRLDWFADTGELENDINLLEIQTKGKGSDATLSESVYHSFNETLKDPAAENDDSGVKEAETAKQQAGDLDAVEENLVTNVEKEDSEEVVLLEVDVNNEAKTIKENSRDLNSTFPNKSVSDESDDNLDITLEAETEHEPKSDEKEGGAGLSDSMREFDCCLLGHSDASYHKEEDASFAEQVDEVESDLLRAGKEAIATNERSRDETFTAVENIKAVKVGEETFTAHEVVVEVGKVGDETFTESAELVDVVKVGDEPQAGKAVDVAVAEEALVLNTSKELEDELELGEEVELVTDTSLLSGSRLLEDLTASDESWLVPDTTRSDLLDSTFDAQLKEAKEMNMTYDLANDTSPAEAVKRRRVARQTMEGRGKRKREEVEEAARGLRRKSKTSYSGFF